MRTTFTFMANKLLACLLFLFIFSTAAYAQSKPSVSGIVVDSLSKAPIEFATVAVVNAKDTSLISYTLTQNNGSFKLTGLPAGLQTKLIISAMGYGSFRQALVFKPGENKETGNVFLNSKSLKEVVIKGERSPVTIRKDTIEFSAEAFKTRPNAVVEDLLKLLPGVQVNQDGTILVNGKNVSKLLIDGKRFFGTDPTVGTKNLDADLVDKIQVYDDREEDPDHQLSDMEVNKIINLKMKSKIKKSTIGKIYAGAGTRDRYEAGGIVSTFRDTLQLSFIGVSNNLTHTGFSYADLTGMGGFNRSGGSSQRDGTFGGNGDGGVERMFGGGVNINNDYGKKLKTNFMYSFYNYVKDYNSRSVNQQMLDQTELTTQTAGARELRQRKHSASAFVEWNPTDLEKFRLDAKMDIFPTTSGANSNTNTFNTQTPQLSNLFNKTSSISQINNFTDNFIYYHKYKKSGASLTINQSLDLKNSGSDDYNYNDLKSFTSAIPTSLLDRYATSIGTVYKARIAGTYNYPFSKTFGNEFMVQSRYTEMSNKLSTYDKSLTGGYDNFLSNQSNNLARKDFIENFQNTLRFDIKKTTLRVGVNLETQAITNDFHLVTSAPAKQSYVALFPVLRLTTSHIYTEYTEFYTLPDINKMQPIAVQTSQLSTITGNPNLTPSRQRRLDVSYYNYNNDQQSYLNLYANASLLSNNVIQVSTKDANGFVTSTYTNKDNAWSAYLGAGRSKQFKKNKTWRFSTYNNLFVSYDQGAFYFNGDAGMQRDFAINASQNFSVNYKSIVTLDATYYFTDQIISYKDVNYPSVNTLRHNVTTFASVNWPNHFIFDFQYQYRYNPQIPAGFPRSANILNPAVTYMFLKQNRAQFKLSAYDLLNQNTMVYRYAANNSITIGENQILRRYVLLTFMYKLNSFKSK